MEKKTRASLVFESSPERIEKTLQSLGFSDEDIRSVVTSTDDVNSALQKLEISTQGSWKRLVAECGNCATLFSYEKTQTSAECYACHVLNEIEKMKSLAAPPPRPPRKPVSSATTGDEGDIVTLLHKIAMSPQEAADSLLMDELAFLEEEYERLLKKNDVNNQKVEAMLRNVKERVRTGLQCVEEVASRVNDENSNETTVILSGSN
eukprot:c15369_g1_i1.p1 GENE.c15369_g1_i1~~c15369_g1_i1.p1  ORF type:complete len:206 (-),score=89.04 c15369_g1_i1:811-1428(-)